VDYTPQAWRPLTKARLIVCVGRGLKDEAAVSLARQLAENIGAEFAGDQSARDAGWVDEAHQVGVTAQEVAPDLYLAFGVRGDTVHNAAMTRARRVIAVHSNPQAAIFPAADLAVVAEPRAFLTALLEQLR
jgi:electron transfer flavoprotein alpha subunit